MSLRLMACLVLFEIFSTAATAPVESTTINTVPETLDCNNDTEVYDQRQNGTENYRIHVNGVVVLVAPAETVLQAAQLGTLQMGLESTNLTSQPQRPKPKPPTATDKIPIENHATETGVPNPKDAKDKNLKLLNLLHMFRSIRHDSEGHVPPPNE